MRTETRFSKIWRLCIAALLVATCPAGDKPNVLFIAVDDLRPSIGCYGDKLAVTPNMDALAARGVRFDRAYCQVAVCNPSRASLMTGLRPDKLGVWTLPIHFREAMPEAVTMPQWFRKSGYTAVSHGKIYHNPTPDPQSWSEPIRPLPALPFPYPDKVREQVQQAREKLPANDWRKNNLRRPSTAAPELPDNKLIDGARTDMAIEDLRRLGKQDEPFFLAMGYIRPHLAWVAPKKYWDLYDPTKLPVLADQKITPDTPAYALHNNSELTHYVDLIDLPKPWEDRVVPEQKARQLMHGYYACVSYVDAQIGRLLKALDDEGLRENTIVVLWSDHGWKLGEYRGWGKMTNYEIDARVPLIISAPGSKANGKPTAQLTELLDLYPTLCDLAGIKTPEFVDGKSLKPVLNSVEDPAREAAFNQYHRRLNGQQYMGYAIRTDEYRMIEWREFGTGKVTTTELYDHRTEHSETRNIAASADPELLKKLTAMLLKSHPRKGLLMTPKVHSSPEPDRQPTKISFSNEAQTMVSIYPISPSGRRGKAKHLKPTEEVTINARIGGVFVVESMDGRIHEIHSPIAPIKRVILTTPNGEGATSPIDQR